MRKFQFVSLFVAIMLLVHRTDANDFQGVDLKGAPCTISKGFGPFDYRMQNPERKDRQANLHDPLGLVEVRHFTPDIESLTGQNIDGNLDYTLRAFPNHHRALFALVRYFTRPKSAGTSLYWRFAPPECYFQRAFVFAPTDPVPHLLYGIYLHRQQLLEDAEAEYRKSLELEPKLIEAQYNLGLLLVDMGKYEEARTYARSAYAGGYPLPGLKDRLEEAGFGLD